MSELLQIFKSERHPTGDIIFIHGLGGDARTTWGFEQTNSWHTWLADDVPYFNIWSYDYEASPISWLKKGGMPLFDRAVNLLALLDGHNLGERQVTFITHSMGGLVAKQMLEVGYGRLEEYGHIVQNVRNILFLGTPHSGSDVATYTNYIESLTRIIGIKKSIPIGELNSHTPELRRLDAWYRNEYSKLKINTKVFFETQDTFGVRVVSETSSDPKIEGVTPIPVDKNHSDLCRPENKSCIVYLQSVKTIKNRLGTSNDINPVSANVKLLNVEYIATNGKDGSPILVPSSGHTLRLTLESSEERAIILSDLRAVLISREKPSGILHPSAGILPVRKFRLQLDCDPPEILPSQEVGENFPLTISSANPEWLEISVETMMWDIEWVFELDWILEGSLNTLKIDLSGSPFRCMARPSSPKYAWHD